MSTTSKQGALTFQAVVVRILSEGGLTPSELAERTGIDRSTITRWRDGDTKQPTLAMVRELFAVVDPRFQALLLQLFTSGPGGWLHIHETDETDEGLDLDQDGRITAADAMAGAMKALRRLDQFVQEVHADQADDGRFDHGEAANVAELGGKAIGAVRKVVAIAQYDAQHNQLRPARRAAGR